MKPVELVLDTVKGIREFQQIIVRQGETVHLTVAVEEDGVPYDFTDKVIDFVCIDIHGNFKHAAVDVTHIGETNAWEVVLSTEVTDIEGFVPEAYFRILSIYDPEFLETTESFDLVIQKSATCRARLAPYSDQLNRLIRAFEALVMAWQNKQIEFEDEFKQLLLDFRQMFQQAEADRNTAFELAETRREHIYQDALEAINAALQGNFDPIAKLYLDSWYDKPGGIVSYDWFQEWQFKHGFVPFLDDETFLEVVFSD